MPQSLVKNLVHLVFSTKHRQPWSPDDIRDSLFAYQAGIFKHWESPALVIGGVEDHVHALFSLSKNHALKLVAKGEPAEDRLIERFLAMLPYRLVRAIRLKYDQPKGRL